MTYPVALQHVPILLVDVADFTSKHRGVERQRVLLKFLQRLLTESARFFMPYGDVWSKWQRHGTGDGYYFWQRAEEALVDYSQRTGKPLEQIYNYACLLALRGEGSRALESLEQCLEAGTITADHVRDDTDWDSLRANPDFEALLLRYESLATS